jgi:hypothetical protein
MENEKNATNWNKFVGNQILFYPSLEPIDHRQFVDWPSRHVWNVGNHFRSDRSYSRDLILSSSLSRILRPRIIPSTCRAIQGEHVVRGLSRRMFYLLDFQVLSDELWHVYARISRQTAVCRAKAELGSWIP